MQIRTARLGEVLPAQSAPDTRINPRARCFSRTLEQPTPLNVQCTNLIIRRNNLQPARPPALRARVHVSGHSSSGSLSLSFLRTFDESLGQRYRRHNHNNFVYFLLRLRLSHRRTSLSRRAGGGKSKLNEQPIPEPPIIVCRNKKRETEKEQRAGGHCAAMKFS